MGIRALLGATLAATLCSACAAPEGDGPPPETVSASDGGASAEPRAREGQPEQADSGSPARLRAAAIRAVQEDAGEAFAWQAEQGAARASSGATRWQVRAGTLEVERENEADRSPPAGAAWSLRLTTVGLGRDDAWRELAAAGAVVDGNEARIRREGLLERWVHGPLGAEHLYELPHRPVGTGVLRIAIEVRGLSAQPPTDGASVLLVDAEGRPRARYSDLFVHDSARRPVPARMEVTGGAVGGARIELRIDDADAEYPLLVDPLLATFEETLRPDSADAGGWFGLAVALSDDGSRAIVGAPQVDRSSFEGSTGSAYVFTRGAGGTWSREAVLTGADTLASAQFGTAVALDGDATRALVGAPQDDLAAGNAGAAYIFVRSGTTWSPEATIRHPTPLGFDRLGQSVALDDTGTRAAIGVPGDDPDVAISDRGTALVYVRGAGGWALEATLAGAGAEDDANLGQSVAIDDAGSRIIAGAPGDRATSSTSGSARVFVRSGSAWTEEAKLVPTDERSGERFGWAVDLSGDASRALVGAPDDRIASLRRGGGWVFVRSGTAWSFEAHLFESSGSGGELGTSVALSADGTRAVLGAPLDDTSAGADSGRVRLFSLDGSTWTEGDVLEAPGAAGDDRFGYGVAISDDGAYAIAGAYRQDGSSPLLGAAHVYTLEQLLGDGAACTSDAECASGFCTDGVCCNISCYGDCRACSVAAGGSTDGTCTPLTAAAAASEVCRPVAGPCDVAETCTAGSMTCGSDALASASTVCRPAAGECDVAETCTGSSAACPANAFQPSDTPCGASASGPCDAADTCDGSGACLTNVSPDGTPCDDGAFCTTASSCGGGACTATAGDPCAPGEVCNESVDMCLALCGNGSLDAGEECDDGDGNSDSTPDACRTTCALPSCGDGVADTGEECDQGGGNSDTAPDACRTDCREASCGDGAIDTGEECDRGADNSDSEPDACRTDCTSARCGDGVVDAGEECDDGPSGSATCSTACVALEADAGMPDAGMPDAGMPDAGTSDDDAGTSTTDAEVTADGGRPAVRDGGCGCVTVGTDRLARSGAWLALVAFGASLWRRARRRGRRARPASAGRSRAP